MNLPAILPPPLDPVEEAALWRQAAAGDAAARQQLITHHLRLVAREAWRVDPTGRWHDRLHDVGLETLCRAARAFDPARGFRFSTLAVLAIQRDMRRAHRRAAREPVMVPWETAPPPAATAPDPADLVAAADVTARLRTALAALPAPDRALLAARYGLDGRPPRSRRTLAARLGVTPTTLARRERRALAVLRAALHAARA